MADGNIDHAPAEGDSYDNAKVALEAAQPGDTKLIDLHTEA